jgi:hypothetical protein
MTLEQFRELPVGTLVKIQQGDGSWEVGEILKLGQEVTIIWPDSNLTQYVGLTEKWKSFIDWLEVEE